MNKAFTGEPEPPVLDVDNLSVSTSVLQHDPFGGDPCTMPHSSTTTTTGPTPSSSATPSAWQTLASPSRNPSIAEPTEPGSRRRAQRSTAHSKMATVGGGNSGRRYGTCGHRSRIEPDRRYSIGKLNVMLSTTTCPSSRCSDGSNLALFALLHAKHYFARALQHELHGLIYHTARVLVPFYL